MRSTPRHLVPALALALVLSPVTFAADTPTAEQVIEPQLHAPWADAPRKIFIICALVLHTAVGACARRTTLIAAARPEQSYAQTKCCRLWRAHRFGEAPLDEGVKACAFIHIA